MDAPCGAAGWWWVPAGTCAHWWALADTRPLPTEGAAREAGATLHGQGEAHARGPQHWMPRQPAADQGDSYGGSIWRPAWPCH